MPRLNCSFWYRASNALARRNVTLELLNAAELRYLELESPKHTICCSSSLMLFLDIGTHPIYLVSVAYFLGLLGEGLL